MDSIEATEIINSKDRFRAFASSIGIPVPQVFLPPFDGVSWPIIVKPIDAYSGRGVSVLEASQAAQLSLAIAKAKEFSRAGAYIIETYVEGSLYSHSAFVSGGEIRSDSVVAEHGSANPFVVDTSWVDYGFPLDLLRRVREDVALMSRELGLVDGLIHSQFIVNDDSYWFIEVTRRCPGDLYAELIERSTGLPYVESYVSGFLGREELRRAEVVRSDHVLRHTISVPEESALCSVEFKVPVRVDKFVPLALAGDIIQASPFGRIGLIFARAESQEELLSLAHLAMKRELYSIN